MFLGRAGGNRTRIASFGGELTARTDGPIPTEFYDSQAEN